MLKYTIVPYKKILDIHICSVVNYFFFHVIDINVYVLLLVQRKLSLQWVGKTDHVAKHCFTLVNYRVKHSAFVASIAILI